MPGDRRRALREALFAFAGTTAIAAVLWQARGLLGDFLHLGIAALVLLAPRWLLDRRRADWADYGLTARPVGRGAAVALLAALVVFPPFLAGFVGYYDAACGAGLMPSLCRRWLGWSGAAFALPPGFASLALGQIVVVALPEEFFYRGYLQGRLAEVWPKSWKVLGAPVGPALLASAALFGVAHVLVDFDPRRLATFFPALVFGWMRQATGSVLAPTLVHAMCNLYIDALHESFFGAAR
jgi:membrane protease YdiL (CAAX protease family)